MKPGRIDMNDAMSGGHGSVYVHGHNLDDVRRNPLPCMERTLSDRHGASQP